MKLIFLRSIGSHLILRWLFSVIGLGKSKYTKQLLLDYLRFSIGEQYEVHEFDLTYLKEVEGDEYVYDAYEYHKGDIRAFLGLKLTKGILLFYNADVLSGVAYKLCGNHYHYLFVRLNKFLPEDQKLVKVPIIDSDAAISYLGEGKSLELVVNEDGNTTLHLTDNKHYICINKE